MGAQLRDYIFPIAEHAIDDYRSVKVVGVGAGFSGVCTAIRFPQRIPNLNLTIYEKNAGIGDTLVLPVIYQARLTRLQAYQFTFESYSQWSEFYSSGLEIRQYLDMVAKKYGADRYIKTRHSVVAATWDENGSIWSLKIHDLEKDKIFSDWADFLVVGTGILNRWEWPDIPGLHDFQGPLLHSAAWDDSFDARDKEIALIGGGSSAIQILPALQPIAKRIDHYNRSKMWIASGGFAGEEAFKRNPTGGNSTFGAEELATFKKDPATYHKYRSYVEGLLNTVHTVTWADSELAQQSEKLFRESMKQKLSKKPEVFQSLDPNYPPVCRRITPGPGYLEAVCEDNVEFISGPIKQVHQDGIETQDGKMRKVDAIITATGFDTTYLPRFPVLGEGGKSLEDVWSDPFPEAYVSIFAAEMPNYMIYLGPNGAPPSGSTILAIESQCDYMIKCIQKCQREGYKSMVVKSTALKAFSGYIDSYMPRTVYSRPCKSWFKRGTAEGRVVALFPGSATAFRYMLTHPRWEDFQFQHTDETEPNGFAWLGIAMTRGEMDKTCPTPYLDSIDVPPLPGMI